MKKSKIVLFILLIVLLMFTILFLNCFLKDTNIIKGYLKSETYGDKYGFQHYLEYYKYYYNAEKDSDFNDNIIDENDYFILFDKSNRNFGKKYEKFYYYTLYFYDTSSHILYVLKSC